MFLGIEIGGTKLQLGVGTGESAELTALERLRVRPELGAKGILEQIRDTGTALLRRHDIRRVGVGFGGPVLGSAGRVIKSHQIAGWDDFPLADWCRDTLGRETRIGNDCDVAALAESRYGAGRGRRTLFYVTVGTGIGGGLVADGMICGTHRPAVAEIGHLRPGLGATDPHQTIEAAASGRGIEQAARRLIEEDVADGSDAAELLTLCGGDPDRLTGQHIAEAAASGNAVALRVIADATGTLGWAIAQAATLVAPDIVVVGGGVSLMGESLFFTPLRDAIARYVFPPLAGTFDLVPAALGESVVVHGAVALAAKDDAAPADPRSRIRQNSGG